MHDLCLGWILAQSPYQVTTLAVSNFHLISWCSVKQLESIFEVCEQKENHVIPFDSCSVHCCLRVHAVFEEDLECDKIMVNNGISWIKESSIRGAKKNPKLFQESTATFLDCLCHRLRWMLGRLHQLLLNICRTLIGSLITQTIHSLYK